MEGCFNGSEILALVNLILQRKYETNSCSTPDVLYKKLSSNDLPNKQKVPYTNMSMISDFFNMEGCFNGSEILALANLLNQGREEDDFDDEQKVKTSTKKTTPVEKEKPKIIRKEEQCDSDEETERKLEQELAKDTETEDWRKTPQWSLIYKQAVSPSDVYLQMSGKTQLTASCEEMVIVVELPGEKAPNIDVKLQKDHLDLVSPQFRLSIPLPHQVDPQKGSAKWDSYKDALILTLVMEREFDFVNF